MVALAFTIHADRVPRRLLISSAAAATCYSVQLAHAPSAPVAVTIECRNYMIQARPSSLFFAPDNWDKAQHVFVHVRHVGTEIGTTARLEHVLRSTDDAFNDRVPWLQVEYAATCCPSILKFGAGSLKCYEQIELPVEDNRAMQMIKEVAEKKVEESTTPKQRIDLQKSYSKLIEDDHDNKNGTSSFPCCDLLEGMSSDSDFGGRAENNELLAEHAARNGLKNAAATLNRTSSAIAISAGDAHSVVLTANGTVFTCGSNELGQLGLGDRKNRGESTMNRIDFVFEEEEEEDPILSLSSSMFSSRLLISAVACGAFHTAAVTSEGSLYAWGSNKFGQLGIGEGATDAVKPRRVPLQGIVSLVTCGGSHTLCSASTGEETKVFGWGNGRTGALGICSTGAVWTPTEVEALRGGVLDLSCGALHTACVDLSGRLLTCGANDSYQLGRSRGARDAFIVVHLPGEDRNDRDVDYVGATACQVGCGGSHTIVLMSSGEVYSVGDNTYGQLGIGGHPSRKRELTRVEALVGVHISSISVGSAASAALTRCGRCYIWGQRSCGQLGDAGPAVSLRDSLQQGLLTARNGPTDDVTLPTLALTLSASRVRRLALGRSHALAITDVTRADALSGRRRALSFLLDVKAHFRVAKAYGMNDKGRRREQQRSFMSFRTWIKTCKLHKVLLALRTDQLVRAHVHARAVTRIKRSRLDRILNKKNVAEEDDAPSYKSTWLDHISVVLMIQSRFAHVLYRPDRYSRVDHAANGILRISDALRLFTTYVQTFLGFVDSLPLRVMSTLHRVAHDLALASAVETLIHVRHRSKRKLTARRLSASKPPPIAVLTTRCLLVGSSSHRTRRKQRRASVDTDTVSCRGSIETTVSRLKTPNEMRPGTETTRASEDDQVGPPSSSLDSVPTEATVPSRAYSYFAEEAPVPDLTCARFETQKFDSRQQPSERRRTRTSRARRRSRCVPETSRPYVPKMLSGAVPIMLRSYNKETRIQMPAEVIEKKLADKEERRRLREQMAERHRREILEMARTRQFEKWLKVAQQSKKPSKPSTLNRRPQSAVRALTDVRTMLDGTFTSSIGLSNKIEDILLCNDYQ